MPKNNIVNKSYFHLTFLLYKKEAVAHPLRGCNSPFLNIVYDNLWNVNHFPSYSGNH